MRIRTRNEFEAEVIGCWIRLGFYREGMRPALKCCRMAAGLTQKAAAEKIGVAPPTLRQWEQGRHWPSAYFLPLMAEAYGCSIEALYLGARRREERHEEE